MLYFSATFDGLCALVYAQAVLEEAKACATHAGRSTTVDLADARLASQLMRSATEGANPPSREVFLYLCCPLHFITPIGLRYLD